MYSDSDSSRPASCISVHGEEWATTYESLSDTTTTLDPVTAASERTALIADASSSHHHLVPPAGGRKKKKTRRNHDTDASSSLHSSGIISYGAVITHLKVILLGDGQVGKTSLLQRYTHNKFDVKQKSTLGMETCVRSFSIRGVHYVLQIWDIAGTVLTKQLSLMPVYCRGAVGAVFVYGVNSQFSLLNLYRWSEVLNSIVTKQNGDPIPSVLIGNKCDLDDQLEHSDVAKQLGVQHHFRCSAQSGKSVNEAFEQLITQIISEPDSWNINDRSSSILSEQEFDQKTSRSCCNCCCS